MAKNTTKPDFPAEYECRVRLAELMQERGLASDREVERLTGVHFNVVRRLRTNETKGIDFSTILRLCLGLRCSPNDLFEIDARRDENAPTSST